MCYLKTEAVFNRAPLYPVEIQNIDGQGHRGLVVDSRDKVHRDIFVNTNQIGGVFLPYRDIARDVAAGYTTRVEDTVRKVMGLARAEEAQKEPQTIHPMSHPPAYTR